jgi:hypothetical protein
MDIDARTTCCQAATTYISQNQRSRIRSENHFGWKIVILSYSFFFITLRLIKKSRSYAKSAFSMREITKISPDLRCAFIKVSGI